MRNGSILHLYEYGKKRVRITTTAGKIVEGTIVDYFPEVQGVAIRDISKGTYTELPEYKIGKIELID